MNIIIRIVVTACALMAVAYIVPGIEVTNIYVALIASVVLGLLNIFVRPILVLLTLPVTLLTLGLFIFVINALLFWFVSSFVDGFVVDGFLPALVGSVLVAFVSTVINKIIT